MSIRSHIHIVPKPSHGILICTHHRYCILPSALYSHFSAKHADCTTVKERRDLQAYVNGLPEQLHQAYDDFTVPTEPIARIPHLRVNAHSLKCQHCGHICAKATATENMKAHLRTHGIHAQSRTAQTHKEIEAWWSTHWEVVCSQQYFVAANSKTGVTRHFEVLLPQEEDVVSVVEKHRPGQDGSNTRTIDPSLTALEQLEARFEEVEADVESESRAQSKLVPHVPDQQTNPYLEHTRFQQCVQGLSWKRAREYTAVGNSRKWKHLEQTVKNMTLVYQYTVAKTSRWARIRVMQENWLHIPVSPLQHYQAYSNQHSNVVVQLFSFFYRVFEDRFCPPATLHVTEAQRSAWGRIHDALDDCNGVYEEVHPPTSFRPLASMERLCHDFWMTLIEQTAVVSDFELTIVTPLAFLAVDRERDQFRAAYNFATELSALKKFIRFASCQKLWLEVTPSVSIDAWNVPSAQATLDSEIGPSLLDENVEEDVERHEAAELIQEQDKARAMCAWDEHSKGVANDQFKEWIYRYLTDAYQTPMSWVISTAHYISKFRYGESLDSFVRWNGSVVSIRGISTTFEKFVGMVWSVYHEAQDALLQLTFADKMDDLPTIPWGKIQCDPSNSKTGYSPFSPLQEALKHGARLARTRNIQAIKEKTHKGCTVDLDNANQTRRYCDRVQHFLRLLKLLVHFTSGQPGRLTEVESLTVENSVNDGPRNIFMFNKHVVLVPRYHKGYNRDKSLKMIYRFLPRQVASLLVWYLWLVRPFYKVVSYEPDESKRGSHYYQSRSPFLWSDNRGAQRKSSAAFSASIKETTKAYLGEAFGGALMRHLIIAFGRQNDKHSIPTSGLTKLDPEEVDEYLQEIHSEAREIQSGHMPNTAKAVYALETEAVFRSKFTTPQAHLKVSNQWHWDLGFDPIGDDEETTHRRERERHLLAERIAKRGPINMTRVLQANFGPTAAFRGRQKEVVSKVMEGYPVVSYIAGTGSGKSLAFYLPASCEDFGQTILITPLVALRDDIVMRCKSLSLLHTIYGTSAFNENARIILAAPEHLGDERFISLVDRRRDLGQLERIVLDEFHYVLLPDYEYRPHLLRLRDITRHATPITLLSATVPPRYQEEAYRLLGVEGRVCTFREPTSRPNLQYEVSTLSQQEPVQVEDMAHYIQEVQKQHSKILVYVMDKVTVTALSTALDCLAYHGATPQHERVRVQEQFKDSSTGILIATTAFNAGIDIPDIRMVMRFGAPDHAITWLQEGGRGGRDGLLCIVRIVLGRGISSFIEKLDRPTRNVLHRLMQTNSLAHECMRIPLDEYADGNISRTCCRQDEAPCTYCQDNLGRNSWQFNTQEALPVQQTRGYESSPCTPAPARVSDPMQEASTLETPGYTLSSQIAFSGNSRVTNVPLPFTSPLVPCQTSRVAAGPAATSGNSLGHSTGSPRKRHRWQTSSVDLGTQSQTTASQKDAKAARISRALDFGREQWLNRQKTDARVVQQQLHQTGAFWTDHCVQCFVDGVSFDHAKGSCGKYTNNIVTEYRRDRMRNQLGKPHCYSCLFPLTHCPKWYDEEHDHVRSNMIRVDCAYPHVVLDTWACLWEYCEQARSIWLQRIQSETDGRLDGAHSDEFRQYFQEMIRLGARKPVGRIAYDVDWFTHEFFLPSENRKWMELLPEGQNMHKIR